MTAQKTKGAPGRSQPHAATDAAEAAIGDAVGAVGDKVGEATVQVKQQAATMQQRMRAQAMEKADERKSRLVEQGKSVTDEGSKIAEQLRSDGMETPAELIQSATRQVRDVLDYVETTPVERMLEDAAARARTRPIAFIGAAFGIGLVASRLLKAQPARPTPEDATGARAVPPARTRRFERRAGAAGQRSQPGATAELPLTTSTAR